MPIVKCLFLIDACWIPSCNSRPSGDVMSAWKIYPCENFRVKYFEKRLSKKFRAPDMKTAPLIKTVLTPSEKKVKNSGVLNTLNIQKKTPESI